MLLYFLESLYEMDNRKRIKEEPDEDDFDKTSKRIKEETLVDVAKVKMEHNDSYVSGVSNHGNILIKNMPKWQKLDDNYEENSNKVKKNRLTDTIITTNDAQRFAVHSIILTAGSDMLKETLMSVRKEGQNYDLTLEEVSGEEFQWMLNYLYDGRVELKDAREELRFKALINLFGLIKSESQEVHTNPDVKDASFFEELLKGGIMKMGKGGKCLQCGKSFKSFLGAKIHFEVKHTIPADASKFTCSMCGQKNSHQCYLESHLREKHGIKKSEIMGAKLKN